MDLNITETEREKDWKKVNRGSGACVYVHALLCPNLCDPVDCSPPASSVH